LHTLKRTVEALQKCKESKDSILYIFCDGIKNEKDKENVISVRNYLGNIIGFKHIELNIKEKNIGVSAIIIEGISSTLLIHDKVIIIEDDIVVSSSFLQYMNQCLNFYKYNPRVLTISGFSIPIKFKQSFKHDVYVLPRTCSWGWGVWKHKWENIDWSVSDFENFSKNKKEIKKFNIGGTDLYKMLWKQMNGKIDAWDIRISYHQYKKNAFTIYPAISKAINIGFDSMASNCKGYNRYITTLDEKEYQEFKLPKIVFIDKYILKQFQDFYSLKSRFIGRLKTEILFLKQRFKM
jgi:hypothetical protein